MPKVNSRIRSIYRTLLVALWLIAPAFAAEHTKDSLDTVKEKIKDEKAVLVDVREEKEWNAGHLQDARQLPLSRLEKGVAAEKLAKILPKDKVIYVHCAAGGRCLPAAEILKKQGYDVRPLKAGYKQLLESGFAKAKPEK
ncbi:MAG TPA: rhodanese-like domain-containing protein [Planctomycetaceae bacterium]|nr:rhodanese-like domain-containing protein [Planctomycetaceae bacterium]